MASLPRMPEGDSEKNFRMLVNRDVNPEKSWVQRRNLLAMSLILFTLSIVWVENKGQELPAPVGLQPQAGQLAFTLRPCLRTSAFWAWVLSIRSERTLANALTSDDGLSPLTRLATSGPRTRRKIGRPWARLLLQR